MLEGVSVVTESDYGLRSRSSMLGPLVSHHAVVPLSLGGGQEATPGIVSAPHHLRAIRPHLSGTHQFLRNHQRDVSLSCRDAS